MGAVFSSGVKQGDKVLTAGMSKVVDGMRVLERDQIQPACAARPASGDTKRASHAAKSLARLVVKHHVIDFRIIVRSANRNIATLGAPDSDGSIGRPGRKKLPIDLKELD